MDDNEVDGGAGGKRTGGPGTADKSAPEGRSGLGLLALGVGVLLCVGLIATIALPRFLANGRKAKMDEVTLNLYGIKTAQFAHRAVAGSFLPAGPHPRTLDELSASHAEWTQGSAFDTLGWGPDGPVQATYLVEVLPDSLDFIAHAWIDADGDGVPAHFTVTRSTHPVRVTPSSVR